MGKPSQEQFEKDVSAHEMTIHAHNGIHRHLTFRASGTFAYGFHITTWPGYLAFSGDMGTFVFSRIPDMFEFFRDRDINPGYWAEKLTAHDRHGGHREFDHDLYVECLKRDFEDWHFDSEGDRRKAWAEIKDEWSGILHASTLEEAIRYALDWKCPVSGQEFTDFWDHTLEDYTYRFIWCCRAIIWAIKRYDAAMSTANDNTPVAANAA
ncbi:hypothetical protein FJ959_09100 [Mesorhizobium sp. B2-2-4]|uniref:hypothetical protein n=1 Tax=unclassified Mesorhizobium TaxID=325217 RepID=UPI00112BAB67|nr:MULTISPECIES: hypothetical protein [unclassified Mesorhizobium]TPM59018.1 hypothetical protein FJ959_09100 [Mesorhizobium sp. B2-2-4]TPM67503.1 hypothetical protein FJ965_10240 [Mesorhizobium sp. B2-2-1]